MTATFQIIVSVVGVGVSIMAALVTVTWHLRGRLDGVERRLDHLESRIEAQFQAVENRMEAQFQAVENRFEHVESRMEARFQAVENQMQTRFERVEDRLDNFGAGIRSLNHQVASVAGLIPSVFAFLHRGHAITDEEYRDSVGQFASSISQGAESLVDHLSRSMNPLTYADVQRFKELVSKARRGEFFAREEALEYHDLIRKVQAEHPDDPRIWPLVALGEFLRGLYRGSRQEDDAQEASPQ